MTELASHWTESSRRCDALAVDSNYEMTGSLRMGTPEACGTGHLKERRPAR
jgi:hypothetical protein